MTHPLKYYFIILIFIIPFNAISSSLDDKLKIIKEVYKLQAKTCPTKDEKINQSARFIAGKSLFESKSLSGNRDISCIDCHLDNFHSTDGLPLAIGVGGKGEGVARMQEGHGVLVQRNALSLKGRGDSEFTDLFWDGKVQIDNGRFVSQFGNKLPDKFDSILAVASILPTIERDELIGKKELFKTNDIQKAVEDKVYYSRYLAVSNAINTRINNPENEEDKHLKTVLTNADISIKSLDLADIGNLIAFFIENNFPCENSPWDSYINSNLNALTEDQKAGAILFYGKGRCVSCHTGKYFTDFSYHSIGTPQGGFGPHTRQRDIGRAGVTNRHEDLYLFRTPPLTLVRESPPYGHNGAFDTLREVIIHHFNPIEFYINNPSFYEKDAFITGKLLDSRDSILPMIELTDNELDMLIEFLNAL